MATEASIEIRGLVKRFGSLTAVDRLDLSVAAGEIYGLLGPNGAGKTTTIRALLGYLKPTEGELFVNGADARDPDVRRRIGYLPGDLRLDRKRHVGQLLRWYGRLRGGVPESRVDELCERLSLDHSRTFGELSKGNRQKVGVVQAVMHEPDVLLLDEPTSGLDPLMQREVLRLVQERSDAGAAVLFSSHIITEVEEVADRVGILRLGRKVMEDTVEGMQTVTQIQKLHLRFGAALDPDALSGVDGVTQVRVDGERATVTVAGSVGPLVSRLAGLDVQHISTDPMLLDDIFYGVYDQQDAADAERETDGPTAGEAS
jgi:ABC-2 type transport system ATP-binding protein